jgi:DNA-binding XRE family transcriptional regulator
MTIGMQLKLARKKKCLTLEQLATQTGLSRSTVQSAEVDRFELSLITAVKLVRELGLTMEIEEGGKHFVLQCKGKADA